MASAARGFCLAVQSLVLAVLGRKGRGQSSRKAQSSYEEACSHKDQYEQAECCQESFYFRGVWTSRHSRRQEEEELRHCGGGGGRVHWSDSQGSEFCFSVVIFVVVIEKERHSTGKSTKGRTSRRARSPGPLHYYFHYILVARWLHLIHGRYQPAVLILSIST